MKVDHSSLKQQAAAYLREQILTGHLAPGTRIDQADVSVSLGISRLPVREALIELAQQGLVESVPRRGAFVAQLDRADITDHYRIYGLVAGLAASRAASTLTADELAELHRLNEQFVAATTPDERARWNHRFHRVMNRAAGSRVLVSQLRLLSRSLPVRFFEFAPQWAATSAQHHTEILRALEARDAPEAQRLVEQHLEESGALAIGILEEMGYWNHATR
jgi:DNA-binding GntR family transcriptional regulator